MPHTFSGIIKKERQVSHRKRRDAILQGSGRYPSDIVANTVLGIHGVGKRKIIQGSRFPRFALEGINIGHVETDIRQ